MKEIKKVLICGLGAIGSIYATKIFDYDKTMVKILVDDKRLEIYKQNPLIFQGKCYDFEYVLPNNSFVADLIIIATKGSGLDSAIRDISEFVGENTIIMSLMNGITSEEKIAAVYGAENVLYSYFVGHTSTRCGRNVTFDGVGDVVFGEKKNLTYSENVSVVKDLLEKIEADYKIPEDMQYSMWKKFALNVGVNQASSLLRAEFKYLQNCKKANALVKNLMVEVGEIAKKIGVENSEKIVDEAMETVFKMKPDAKTSMLQDVLAKRKTEVDLFAGTVVELGKKLSIDTPYNNMVLEILSAQDEMIDY